MMSWIISFLIIRSLNLMFIYSKSKYRGNCEAWTFFKLLIYNNNNNGSSNNYKKNKIWGFKVCQDWAYHKFNKSRCLKQIFFVRTPVNLQTSSTFIFQPTITLKIREVQMSLVSHFTAPPPCTYEWNNLLLGCLP